MICSCEISGSWQRQMPAVNPLMVLVAVLLALLSGGSAAAATSVYIFDPNQSTVTKTGGFAGVHESYFVEGRFQLSVEGNTTVFEEVDASLTDEAGSVYLLSLDEVFNMTALGGDPNGLNTIVFKGKTADGTESDVTITLTFEDSRARLTGGTTPPPNSADLFFYELDAVATRKYAGGTGEPNDPYLIYTAEQMNAIGAESSDWDSHFKLTADIDLSGFTGTDFNIIGRWRSISFNRPFRGVFDGSDHAISNFSYSCPDTSYVGLFGYVAGRVDQDTIKNLRLIDPNVDTETGNGVGSLVGWLRSGTVTACSVEGGIVSGSIAVGGLVGTHGSTSESPTFPPPTPYPPPYTISKCYSTAVVVGRVGIGGLVGSNSGLVTECYSTGTVSGDIQVGGLVGVNYRCNDGQCFSGSVHNSYSASIVTGDDSVGGLVGDGVPDEVINSFWDTETSGQQTSGGGTGETTAEMQTAVTFLDAGWDFADETVNGTEDIWWIDEGKVYPRLSWELGKYGGGTGEPNDPYLIYTAAHLNTIGAEPSDWDRHFKLTADIDLSGYLYDTALIAPGADPCDPAFQLTFFGGTFDGNGHAISNLKIQGGEYLGLFGILGTEAVVKNLGLVDVNIAGSDCVGALTGFNWGHIKSSRTTGTVSGKNRVGGFVGANWGSIITSYNEAAVTENSEISDSIAISYDAHSRTESADFGGIAGENNNSIVMTYSTGVISGPTRAGGLVGYSYNRKDEAITASFWDIETSDQTISDGGAGKRTAEMQTASTFLEAGWDFVDETANGTDDIWWILEGQDYPRLWWESDAVGR